MLTKRDYDNMLQFVLRLQEANNNFRQQVLTLLSEMFGHQLMTFFLVDDRGYWAYPIGYNISREAFERYASHYFKIDMFHTINMPKHLLARKVVSVTDFMPYERFETTEFYNDFLKKYGLDYEIAMPLTAGDRLLGIIGVFRPKQAGDFTAKNILVLSTLNKHICAGLRNSLDVADIKYEHHVLKTCSSDLPVGLILLNSRFSILHFNETAKCYCLDITGNRQPAQAMQQVIDQLLARFTSFPSNSDMVIDSHSFKITPFIVPSKTDGIESAYVVYITRSSPARTPPFEEIAAQFGLTKRETEIVNLIMEGLNNKEIAAKLYVTVHTVKSHILNIFDKTNVSRRTALISKINQLSNKGAP